MGFCVQVGALLIEIARSSAAGAFKHLWLVVPGARDGFVLRVVEILCFAQNDENAG